MRTNIDIDDELMAAALAAGPFRTKREAVEAGLKLLQRQAAARRLLELEGKVDWGWGDEEALAVEPKGQAGAAPHRRAADAPPARKSTAAPARSGKRAKAAAPRKAAA